MNIRRFSENPIIRPDMLGPDGDNINGPSLIEIPEWVPGSLGRFYLYFAHHRGTYIRLAHADRLEGPWRIHPPGTLRLNQTPCGKHVASPDIHLDQERKKFIMFFHGDIPEGQKTFLARSKDGLQFSVEPHILGPSYFRVFRQREYYYALSKTDQGCRLSRSKRLHGPFEPGPDLLPSARHTGVLVQGEFLTVFFSRIGDTPESILMTRILLNGGWRRWRETSCVRVLSPDEDYEGGLLPCTASRPGPVMEAVRELRDPFPFQVDQGQFLLYAVAGEKGIAIGELLE